MTSEKTSKLREIKESIFGAVAMMNHVKDPGVQESFGKMLEAAKFVKEIIESLKTPDMVKNIENFRLISENINITAGNLQDVLHQIKDTGVIDETKELVKSLKNTMTLVSNTGQDLREVGVAVKEIFKPIRTTHDTKYNTKEKYQKSNEESIDIVVTMDEVERYLKLGWQYVETLPNGKIIVRKIAMHNAISADWIANMS